MRLEDWQRWLDSQFLDADSAPQEAEQESTPPIAPVVTEPAVAASEPYPFTVNAPTETALLNRESAEPSSSARTFLSPSLPPPEEGEIPSIERYLPFLNNRAVVEQPSATAPPSPTPTAKDTESLTSEVETTASAPVLEAMPPPFVRKGEEKKAALAEETEPTTSVAEAAQEEPAPTPTEEPPAKPRRYGVSHRRARHARNVRPAEVVEEMSPSVLWNLVPRHIQTLVALGSDEVAQNSYKRAFKEARLDLVQRLLDPTLSLEDTARLLSVCPTTVRRYTNKGLLTHQRTAGDQRRFKLSDVLAFLEAQGRAER
jgi:excisionase family DNA binding protein